MQKSRKKSIPYGKCECRVTAPGRPGPEGRLGNPHASAQVELSPFGTKQASLQVSLRPKSTPHQSVHVALSPFGTPQASAQVEPLPLHIPHGSNSNSGGT